ESITFKWQAVPGATGYLVSTDNGATYNPPGNGSNSLSQTISNLTEGQSVTILVEAVGDVACELSQPGSYTAIAHSNNTIIYIANAFTPNGDGVNDVVYVHSSGIASMNFYIYNQWGAMVFKSSDQSVGWDGTYKGTLQPVGVYLY